MEFYKCFLLFSLFLQRIYSIELDHEQLKNSTISICDICHCDDTNVDCTYYWKKFESNVYLNENLFEIENNKDNINELRIDNRHVFIDYYAFKSLYNLKLLDIRHVDLHHTLYLNNLVSLEELTIKKTQLESIDSDICVNKADKLYKIDFSYNYLTVLNNVFSNCTSLTLLDLSHNNLMRLNDITNILSNIKVLNLAYNSIEYIDQYDLKYLKNINELILSHNQLKFIHENAFNSMPKLKKLNLQNNNIKQLPQNKATYANLTYLNIESNVNLIQFPNSAYFEKIVELKLHYSYHCCAFIEMNKKLENEINKLKEEIKEEQQLTSVNKTDDDAYMTDYVDELIEAQVVNINAPKEPHLIKCTPLPDPLTPCENLLGKGLLLRISVCFISTMGIACNIFAIIFNVIDGIYLYHSTMFFNVPVFLLTNLALSDLFMSIYLIIIAIKDISTRDHFDKVALIWQHSSNCNMAGFLSILSFMSSALILAFVTFERFYVIKNSIHFNKRIGFKTSIKVTLCIWFASIIVASMPLNGINSYSAYAICLPLDTTDLKAKTYISFLILLLFSCFMVICMCYGMLFLNTVSLERRASSSSCNSDEQIKIRNYEDQRLARNIFLLIAANIIAWSPCIVICMVSIFNDNNTISRYWLKILAVFIMPLNSLINPVLYCLRRRRFRFYLSKFFLRERAIPQSASSTSTLM